MDRPTVCIMLLTHARDDTSPRVDYARRTLVAALTHLRYDGPIRLHIADDGSFPDHPVALQRLARRSRRSLLVSSSSTGGTGYGASYNLATQVVHGLADIILPLEDDWELMVDLDISPYVDDLLAGPMGCIRMGYLGYTQTLRGSVCSVNGRTYLMLDPLSPEPHVWAGHPRLETVAWQRRVGPWPEGLPAGETEFEVSLRGWSRAGVAWPIGLEPHSAWEHIGTVQAREG